MHQHSHTNMRKKRCTPRPIASLAIVVGVTLSLAARTAGAQVNADTLARENFDRGVSELQAQRFATALLAFEASYRLREVPVTLYNMGLAYRGLSRNAEAVLAFDGYLQRHEPDADPTQLDAVRRELERLRTSVSTVRVQLDPPTATLTVDGREHAPSGGDGSHVLDPGRHVLEAAACGYRPARRETTVAAGETQSIALALARPIEHVAPIIVAAPPVAAPPPPPGLTLPPLVVAGGALSIAGLAAAALLRIAGDGLRDDYVTRCVEPAMPATNCNALHDARVGSLAALEGGTYVAIGTAVVGAVLIVAGILVRPAQPRTESARRAVVSFRATPAGVGMTW